MLVTENALKRDDSHLLRRIMVEHRLRNSPFAKVAISTISNADDLMLVYLQCQALEQKAIFVQMVRVAVREVIITIINKVNAPYVKAFLHPQNISTELSEDELISILHSKTDEETLKRRGIVYTTTMSMVKQMLQIDTGLLDINKIQSLLSKFNKPETSNAPGTLAASMVQEVETDPRGDVIEVVNDIEVERGIALENDLGESISSFVERMFNEDDANQTPEPNSVNLAFGEPELPDNSKLEKHLEVVESIDTAPPQITTQPAEVEPIERDEQYQPNDNQTFSNSNVEAERNERGKEEETPNETEKPQDRHERGRGGGYESWGTPETENKAPLFGLGSPAGIGFHNTFEQVEPNMRRLSPDTELFEDNRFDFTTDEKATEPALSETNSLLYQLLVNDSDAETADQEPVQEWAGSRKRKTTRVTRKPKKTRLN